MGDFTAAFVKQSFTFLQIPALQVPLRQTVPHMPQFLASLCMSTQAPPQFVWAPVQVTGAPPVPAPAPPEPLAPVPDPPLPVAGPVIPPLPPPVPEPRLPSVVAELASACAPLLPAPPVVGPTPPLPPTCVSFVVQPASSNRTIALTVPRLVASPGPKDA